jgi:hypothetical protein
MIRGEDIDPLMDSLGESLSANRDDLRGQFFEPTEASEWFGEAVEMSKRPMPPFLAGRQDLANDLVDVLRAAWIHINSSQETRKKDCLMPKRTP